jgi:hypothetical protein
MRNIWNFCESQKIDKIRQESHNFKVTGPSEF